MADLDQTAPTTAPPTPAWLFYQRRQFLLKTILIAVTTVAFIPILLYKSEMAAVIAVSLLIVAHIAGGIIIAIGVKRHQIAPDRRGMIIRLAGLTILVLLIWLAASGLKDHDLSSNVFWGALFAIWALHTAGLALLHLRSRREQSVCPFV
ncbi:MAG: hypothetical protein V4510_02130 [bacterium]